MRDEFLDALHDKYTAEISDAKAKANVYLNRLIKEVKDGSS